uniref:C2H2-type domain-containing protein n=1 Tax=Ditylenchus dipsaci TaxID=166011 RepID=A0A915EU70_9BILA
MLECGLCQNTPAFFPCADDLEAHLASEHYDCLPYECEKCHFAKFPTEFAVIKHMEVDHRFQVFSFRCRITPEVMAKRKNCTTSSSCFDASPLAAKVESEESLQNNTNSIQTNGNNNDSPVLTPQTQLPMSTSNGRNKLAEARQQQMQQFAKLSSSSSSSPSITSKIPLIQKEVPERRQAMVAPTDELQSSDLNMSRGNITVTEAVEAFCNKMLKMEEQDSFDQDFMDQQQEDDEEEESSTGPQLLVNP